MFLSVGGGRTTIQEAYDIMVNLTILIYFLPYLYLFASFIRLRSMDRSMPADDNTIVLPGGSLGAWAIAGCGLIATVIAMGLVFVPPTGTENVLNYEVNLIGQAAMLIAIGMGLYFTREGNKGYKGHTKRYKGCGIRHASRIDRDQFLLRRMTITSQTRPITWDRWGESRLLLSCPWLGGRTFKKS